MTSQWRISAIKYKICFTSEGLVFVPQKANFAPKLIGVSYYFHGRFFKTINNTNMFTHLHKSKIRRVYFLRFIRPL